MASQLAELVERAVASRMTSMPTPIKSPPHPRVSGAAQAASVGRDTDGANRQCHACGRLGRRNSKFCSQCGAPAADALDHITTPSSSPSPFAPTAPAPPTPAGQSSADTGVPKEEGLTKRDKELRRKLIEGDAHPLFVAEAISVEDAFKEVKRAYGAVTFAKPTPTLVALIQSGKLDECGYAIPLKVKGKSKEMDKADALIALNAGDQTAKLLDNVSAPDVKDSDQFFRALTQTIIPALITRPRAIMQWMALATSVLQVKHDRGWAVAAEYLRFTLASCVEARESIAHSTEALETVRNFESSVPPPPPHRPPPAAPAAAAQPHPAPHQSPPRPQPGAEFCRNWNRDGICKFNSGGKSCRHQHRCSNPACGDQDAVVAGSGFKPSHPAYLCPSGRVKQEGEN